MLSISAMSGGQGAYYTGLAREDYYLEGGEPPGSGRTQSTGTSPGEGGSYMPRSSAASASSSGTPSVSSSSQL